MNNYSWNRVLNLKETLFWAIAIIFILANLFFSLISLIEIYEVGFTELEKHYHWNAEPFPWYYESKNIYLAYISCWTTIFLIILFFQIYYLIKDNKYKELISAFAFFLVFIIMLIANGPMN